MCFSLCRQFYLASLWVCLWAALAVEARPEPLLEIEQVRFQTLRDQWLRTEVRVRALGNAQESNPRYTSNIRIELILSFQRRDGEFLFYRARASLVTLEQNQRAAVAFYLPGVILRRDDLREPFAYLVDVSASGQPQPYGREWASANIRENPMALESLRNRSLQVADQHDGILLPAYLAPEGIRQPVNPREQPVYRRPEPEL